MATSISTSFDSICFSSQLPQTVLINTTAAQLTVDIYLDSVKVFSSPYYPYNGAVKVCNIRSIIEESMHASNRSLETMKIVAAEPGQSSSDYVDNIKVVYCNLNYDEDPEEFLTANFMTTRRSALIPKDAVLPICYYLKANVQQRMYMTIYYTLGVDTENVQQYEYTLNYLTPSAATISSINLSYAYCRQLLIPLFNNSVKPKAAIFHVGNRQFAVYFTDEVPTEYLRFCNAFNKFETVAIFGKSSVKTDVEKSEAICNRTTQFYDRSVKVTHEVETAPMTYDEAIWINQLLTSRAVYRIVNGSGNHRVLIDDISSEVTDANKELVRIKFSWKYADDNEWLE